MKKGRVGGNHDSSAFSDSRYMAAFSSRVIVMVRRKSLQGLLLAAVFADNARCAEILMLGSANSLGFLSVGL